MTREDIKISRQNVVTIVKGTRECDYTERQVATSVTRSYIWIPFDPRMTSICSLPCSLPFFILLHSIPSSSHPHSILLSTPFDPHPIQPSSHPTLIPSDPHPIQPSSHPTLIPSNPHPIRPSFYPTLIPSNPHPIRPRPIPYRRQERKHGDFTMTFRIPEQYQRKWHSCTVEDGVMCLRFLPDADEEET